VKKLVLVALIATLLTPLSAQAAQTKFVGGPLTNLDYQSATINITLTDVPTKGGLYIQQCVEAPAGTRSALCNKAVELWISTARGASFLPTAAIVFKPTGSYLVGTTTVDCLVSKCGLFMRFDHTVPADFSEDQFFPLTFKAAVAGSTTLASAAPVTVILPIRLTLGVQSLGGFALPETAKAFSKSALPSTSNFGEKVKYKATGACSVIKAVLTVRRGKCEISATAVGKKALYEGLNQMLVTTGK